MKHFIFITLALALLVCGCDQKPHETEESAAPILVSSSPQDGAEGIKSGKLTITLVFDQNIKRAISPIPISISPEAKIGKVNDFNEKLSIELEELKDNSTYTVTLSSGAITGFKPNQKATSEISISFSTEINIALPSYSLNPSTTLSNPKATAEAKSVYNFLLQQSGKKIISGVQSSSSNTNDFVDEVATITGAHPALAGYDFIFLHYSPTPEGWSWVQNYSDISAAKEHWAKGGIVSYMWHWNVPTSKLAWDNGLEKRNFDGYNFYSEKTNFSINNALTEGTWENEFILKDIEEAASYLKLLQDAGIAVIWRPLHEAAGNYDLYGKNGAWFWWGKGGSEPCKKLWKLLYDKFTNTYGLNNLIWVWTLDAAEGAESSYDDWYPGDEYVDIIGVDIYADNTESKARQYQAAVNLGKGKKLVTISECGNIPDPVKCLQDEQAWSWFMVWPSTRNSEDKYCSFGYKYNTESYWKKVMSSSQVLTRENMPKIH